MMTGIQHDTITHNTNNDFKSDVFTSTRSVSFSKCGLVFIMILLVLQQPDSSGNVRLLLDSLSLTLLTAMKYIGAGVVVTLVYFLFRESANLSSSEEITGGQFCCGEETFIDYFKLSKEAIDKHRRKDTGDATVERSTFIRFPFTFDEDPKVMVGFKCLDLDNLSNYRVNSSIVAITKEGFMLKCFTWHDSKMYKVKMSWVACSQTFGDMGTVSLSFKGDTTFGDRLKKDSIYHFSNILDKCQLGAAISSLDFKRGKNIRLSVNTEFDAEKLYLTAKTWADSVLWTTRVSWFIFDSQAHVQSGREQIDFNTDSEQNLKEVMIQFNPPFERKPKAVVMLSMLDIDQNSNARVHICAKRVDARGMIVEASTWKNSKLYCIEITWIAAIEG